jgi:hypothetical protein
MSGPLNASAPDAVSIEGRRDLTGRLIDANDVAPGNYRPCVVACSLPARSCQYRCPNLAVSR